MAVWAMSRHHLLELLDILGVAAANRSTDLEVPTLAKILAFYFLRRDP
jgi:hypothetical protein